MRQQERNSFDLGRDLAEWLSASMDDVDHADRAKNSSSSGSFEATIAWRCGDSGLSFPGKVQ
jgi:hypothetical protein